MQAVWELILRENGYTPFLFAALLWWTLKKNDEREKRYIEIVDNRLTNVEQKVDNQDVKLDKILEIHMKLEK